MNIFRNSMTERTNEMYLKRTQAFNDKKIKEVIEMRKFEYAVLLKKTEAQHIIRNPSNIEKGRPIFHTVSECPIPCSIVYGLRYGSPYLPRINYILHCLNQAGILQYWSKTDELGVNTHFNKLLANSNSKDIKTLSMQNLQEVFYVWLNGLFLSCISFLIEILWSSYQKRWRIV